MLSIAVHGGAWDVPDELLEAHIEGVQIALETGWKILKKGGSAVDAVERAIITLEDDPTFNAGRGSAINALGQIELDAGMMDGDTLRAGAVACVQNFRHPISIARSIMNEGDHVLLAGVGAARFAREHGFHPCQPEELIVPHELSRWKDDYGQTPAASRKSFAHAGDTVGVVAMDSKGRIVAGSSTGGTPHKHPGRIGDSPLLGAGTYADNEFGGVATTGQGEGIMKIVMAKTIAELMARNRGNAPKAVRDGLALLAKKANAQGGAIAMNTKGEIGVAYTTKRMPHAYVTARMKKPIVAP